MGNLSCFEIITKIIELFFVAIGGVVLGILSYKRTILDAVWQWTQLDGSPEVMDSRRYIQYELQDDYNPDDIRKNINNAAAKIAPAINAYHHLGMLVSRGYFPVNIFENNSTGRTIVIIYKKLLPYVESVRAGHNSNYANGLEFIYNKIKKYYK